MVCAQLVVLSHRAAGGVAVVACAPRVRSSRVVVANARRAGGVTAVISTEQPARERQLGLRFWRETADDFARAALRLGLNGRLPATDLRADAFRVQQNFFGTLRMVVLQ